jgi:hypothetical protein
METMKIYTAVFSGGSASAFFLVYAPSRSEAYIQLLKNPKVADYFDHLRMDVNLEEIHPTM